MSDPEVGEGGLRATVIFYPKDGNAGSPLGKYASKGSFTSNTFVLNGDYWIDDPGGYVMTDLTASAPEGDPLVLKGNVDGAGCKQFEVTKVSKEATPPPL
ncbi:hypothetical protein WBG99_16810 [Streptomyces sp. TG1A-60]|uniref:hypothetical protein n=1 Tax=Streptomyces sp. TG1A-60 TaxID=3129111 RepID=UPI0030CFC8A7